MKRKKNAVAARADESKEVRNEKRKVTDETLDPVSQRYIREEVEKYLEKRKEEVKEGGGKEREGGEMV